MMTTAAVTISVIMPAFRAAGLLPRVLEPLMGMLSRGEVAEVIVVDDQSPDATAEVARCRYWQASCGKVSIWRLSSLFRRWFL